VVYGKIVGDLNANVWECNCEEDHIHTFINTAGLLLMERLRKNHADHMRDRRGHSSVPDGS
jgi:REP element-mobilizing transposase RayT